MEYSFHPFILSPSRRMAEWVAFASVWGRLGRWAVNGAVDAAATAAVPFVCLFVCLHPEIHHRSMAAITSAAVHRASPTNSANPPQKTNNFTPFSEPNGRVFRRLLSLFLTG